MKFQLTEKDMATLKTGTLLERIRVFRDATGWDLKMSKDACEAIMSGRMKVEEFFVPKTPCPHCGGSGFVNAASNGKKPEDDSDPRGQLEAGAGSLADRIG